MLEFQSHAGSIEADIPQALDHFLAWGFNPTLVRLRPAPRLIAVPRATFVSIPRWFD